MIEILRIQYRVYLNTKSLWKYILETYKTLPLNSLTLYELLTAQLIFNLPAMKEKVDRIHRRLQNWEVRGVQNLDFKEAQN